MTKAEINKRIFELQTDEEIIQFVNEKKSIRKFRWIIMGYLFKYLNRRSQRKSFTWSEFERLLEIMNMPKANIRASIYAI